MRALAKAGHRPLRVYDLRHTAATTWLRAGVPLDEVARRLGHSVETLVSTYVGALQGDDTASNKLIDTTLAGTRHQIVVSPPGSSRALPAVPAKDTLPDESTLRVTDTADAAASTPREPVGAAGRARSLQPPSPACGGGRGSRPGHRGGGCAGPRSRR